MPPLVQNEVAAVILAGGKSRRMRGTDKSALRIDNQSLLQRITNLMQNEFKTVLLNTNQQADINIPNTPRIQDLVPDGGPLEGITSTMAWLQANKPDCEWLFSVSVDCPFLPKNLLQPFADCLAANPQVDIVLARSGGQEHFVIGLWSLRLAESARHFLDSGERAVKKFISAQRVACVDFSFEGIDPFFNINTPADYEYAQAATTKA